MSGSKRLSIRAGMTLARTTFDTDLFPVNAIRLDAWCELNELPLRTAAASARFGGRFNPRSRLRRKPSGK
jgi:hypothetical protein